MPIWLGFAMAAAVLAGASVEARRRLPDENAAGRFLRIVLVAGLLAGAITLFGVTAVLYDGSMRHGLVPFALFSIVLLTLIFLALVASLDFGLGLLRPRRSRAWLAASMATFVLGVFGVTGLASWLAGTADELWNPEALQLAILAASGGIVWWSRLPGAFEPVERRFE